MGGLRDCLRPMATYLLIALSHGGSLLEVEASQDGVLAEALLDVEYCLLHLTFAGDGFLCLLLTLGFGLIVGKEVQLNGSIRLVHLAFAYDVIGRDVQTAYEEVGIHYAIEDSKDSLCDETGRRGGFGQPYAAICWLRYGTSVVVHVYLARILVAYLGSGQAFAIVPDADDDLIRDETLIDEVERDAVCHFLDDHSCLGHRIGACQNLSAG